MEDFVLLHEVGREDLSVADDFEFSLATAGYGTHAFGVGGHQGFDHVVARLCASQCLFRG